MNKLNPILKWAGGKRQLLPELINRLPDKFNKYIEPFVGGGALFFYLAKANSIINDSNPELINLYKEVSRNYKKIIVSLKNYKNTKEFFYKVRNTIPSNNLDAACRMIYLNRTCFNGLYRVNRKGQFNVPFGNYKSPKFIDEKNLEKASELLKKTKIYNKNYTSILDKYASKGDLIFLDPPYLPISKFSDFKRYTKEQFYLEDHKILSKYYDKLSKKGCFVILTNSNSKSIIELYKNYNIKVCNTKRNINSFAKKRTGQDIIVTNF